MMHKGEHVLGEGRGSVEVKWCVLELDEVVMKSVIVNTRIINLLHHNEGQSSVLQSLCFLVCSMSVLVLVCCDRKGHQPWTIL